ncbi:hypothetical protein BJF79_07775 [Actinomadura sp. CNU-125]|nr:hypothetical protein BJF79_07775 [Actinomadura sp. CNU-125]
MRVCTRHIVSQVRASSLIVRISGACVRMTAPVSRMRRHASVTMSGSSSRGCVKCAMNARFLPDSTTCSNRRSMSSASGSVTNFCGQYASDLVPMRIDSSCSRSSSGST